jgi:anti-anti-sigma factor
MSVTAITMEGVLRLGFSEVEALDAVNAESVKDEALSRVGEAAEFVVDLSGVEFVDSAGVGVLVALFKTARRNGGRARASAACPRACGRCSRSSGSIKSSRSTRIGRTRSARSAAAPRGRRRGTRRSAPG